MRPSLTFVVVLSGLPLLTSGCNSRGGTQQAGSNTANSIDQAAAMQMPPAIVGGHTYRCEDNSVIRVDYLAGDQGALLQPSPNAQPIRLASDHKGGVLVANGYAVTGRGATIALRRPVGPPQRCKG